MSTTNENAQGANRNPDVKFMSVSDFKTAIGATKLEVLRNPNTGKLFMSADGGANYRVQADLDPKESLTVLVEADDLENACLINGGLSAIITL